MMKHEFLKHSGSKSLVLFFTGWGMDATPFRTISINCDMAVIWNYEDFNIDTSQFSDYQNNVEYIN